MEQFPGNSHRSQIPAEKPTEKKVEKVVTGKVITRKPSLGRRVASLLVGEEAKSSWSAVAQDVVVPAIKDMVTDALSQGIERLVYGEARSRPRRGPLTSGFQQGPTISYNRYNNPVGRASGVGQQRDEGRPFSRSARAQHNFDEIILATRPEAQLVVDRLYDLLSRYEVVTVGDLYELVGITGKHTDEKYGWTELHGTDITRIRDGYLINLPTPEVLD